MWCPKNFQPPVKWVLGLFSGVKLPGSTSEHPSFHSAEVEYKQNSNCTSLLRLSGTYRFRETLCSLFASTTLYRRLLLLFFCTYSGHGVCVASVSRKLSSASWGCLHYTKTHRGGQRNLFLSGTWLKTCLVFVTYFMYFGIMFILLLKLWFSSDIINL